MLELTALWIIESIDISRSERYSIRKNYKAIKISICMNMEKKLQKVKMRYEQVR